MRFPRQGSATPSRPIPSAQLLLALAAHGLPTTPGSQSKERRMNQPDGRLELLDLTKLWEAKGGWLAEAISLQMPTNWGIPWLCGGVASSWSEPAYQLCPSLLFGLPMRLLETLWKRLCGVLISSFFSTMWRLSMSFAAWLDLPSWQTNSSWCKKQGAFLGLTHEMRNIGHTRCMSIWGQERLQDKIKDMVATAPNTGRLTRELHPRCMV